MTCCVGTRLTRCQPWHRMAFAFADEPSVKYTGSGAGARAAAHPGSEFLHTPRVPELAKESVVITSATVGLLHTQFCNWENFILKQAWYMLVERKHKPERPPMQVRA